MKIAIEGCAHGELNKIYETIAFLEERENVKIDLLLCCGDFQSVRNMEDMRSMAVPPKYMQMADFHEYYNGVKTAPVLTVFIGGNHESARYLWELPYGGWVAPNIYYVGYAGVINFAGVRIGGLSGIYKHGDYYKGHFEKPPFDDNTKRSFYHVRSIDVAKVKLLANNDLPIDVFMSHDWPRNIYHHGDCQQLLRFKPFFKEEIEKCELGSEAAEDVLKTLKPMYWFSAHLHAKFSALYSHENGKTTRFLALDKCLPKRNFLQVIDLGAAKEEAVLKYDLQWLAILRKTNAIQSSSSKQSFLVELDEEYKPTPQAVEEILNITNSLDVIPFSKSESGVNQQTEIFCERYGLVNPCTSQQAIVNNPQGSSQRTLIKNKKLSLPKPKGSLSLPKPKLAINLPPLKSEISQNDDFGEIVRPSTASSGKDDFGELVRPSRPESPISDIDSNGSSINSEESDNEDISPTKAVNQSFSSFIETPCKSTPESNFRSPMGLPQARNSTPHSPSQTIPESPLARESQLDSSTSDDCKANLQSSFDRESEEVETPPPIVKKKKTLVRRNQQVYDQPEK